MLRFGVDYCFGLKFLHLIGLVLGYWITLKPSRKKLDASMSIFATVSTIIFVCQSLFSLYSTLRFSINSYVNGVIYAVSIITILKHLFCVLYFYLSRREIIEIFLQLQVILDRYNYPFVNLQAIARKISRRIIAFYFIPPAFYILLMKTNYISSIELNYSLGNATNIIPEGGSVRNDLLRFYNVHSEGLLHASVVVSTFSNLREIVANAFLLSAYTIVAEQIAVLKNCLSNILESEKSILNEIFFTKSYEHTNKSTPSAENLEAWQTFQQHTARVLDRINKYAAPIIVISISSYVALLTLSAFALIKTFSEPSFAANFMAACVLYLTEIYLYCDTGHRIKLQTNALVNVIYHGPWLTIEEKLIPVMHFLTVDCQRSFQVTGGPFFTLSLEFFASVVGVVFTYFIVAMQIK